MCIRDRALSESQGVAGPRAPQSKGPGGQRAAGGPRPPPTDVAKDRPEDGFTGARWASKLSRARNAGRDTRSTARREARQNRETRRWRRPWPAS
eukprot:13472900-Alexandrium_andersonii.AAC.1